MYNNFTQNEWKTNLNYKNLQFSLFKKSRVLVLPHTGGSCGYLKPPFADSDYHEKSENGRMTLGVKDKGKANEINILD